MGDRQSVVCGQPDGKVRKRKTGVSKCDRIVYLNPAIDRRYITGTCGKCGTIKVKKIAAFILLMLSTAVAQAEEFYDKYDVRGLNRVFELQLERVAYTNKDVPHVNRTASKANRNIAETAPIVRTDAQKQVAFSTCVRGITKTKRYQAIVQKSDGWKDPAALRMEKAIAWQEENDKCLEANR